MVRKLYRTLTEDQIKRGVVFSSALSENSSDSAQNVTVHEITEEQIKEDSHEANEIKRRLLDDSFFNKSSYKYNIIRS